jgi:hypothetical protein
MPPLHALSSRSRGFCPLQRMSWYRLAPLGFVGAVLFPRPAEAASRLDVTLAYEMPADPTCPGDSVFRADVRHRLGYDPFVAEATLHVDVQATQTHAGLSGQVEWRDDAHEVEGQQAFPPKQRTCKHLIDEMAFAVAVQIELLGVARAGAPMPPAHDREREREREPSPAPPPVPSAPSPSAPVAPVEAMRGSQLPPVAPAAPTPWTLSGSVGAAADFGFAPTVTASARMSLELQRGHLRVQVAGEVIAPSSWHASDGSGFRQYAAAGELGLCGVLDRFALCGLGSLGRVWVQGFGVDEPENPSGWVARTGLRLLATQPLGQGFALALRADGLALLTPWKVGLNGLSVWSLPAFASTAGLDVVARFP